MNSLISVIVPVYNVEKYLARCVDSILRQTYENLEVILVDDGSHDASGQICEELAKTDARIRVIHKENGGLSSARNCGIEQARGDYLAFVDSDDWIEPESYRWMLERAEQTGAPMVCAGRYDYNSATGEKTLGLCPVRDEEISGEEFAARVFTWDNADSSACDKLYRAELFEGIRYPLGKTDEDVPVTYLLALRAGRVALLSRPIYNYFHRPGSITTASVTEKNFHLEEHTEAIFQKIRAEHPAIADQARYLRVRSLVHPLVLLETSGEEARTRFSGQYRFLRRELRKHIGFIGSSSLFSKREKLEALLLMLGLYRGMRTIYYIAKGKA